MNGIKDYIRRIYEARYFWLHLAKMDLKNKFRRSKLGILWVSATPLGLMIIMTLVFGTVFGEDVETYAPYVLSGLLFWNIVTDALVAGWTSIFGNDPYIRQFNHPIVIYPLEKAIASIVCFVISTASLAIIELLVNPVNVIIGYLSLPISLIFYFVLSWSGTIIASYIGTKYRDYPQLISLLLQAVWYISPVFLRESVFLGNPYLSMVYYFNPITHLLKLFRTPFLEGKFPSITNYLVTFATCLVFAIVAIRVNKKNERDIIFYM